MDRLRARILLDECTGRDIWSIEYCRAKQIPDTWISELKDCFESGFAKESQKIFHNPGKGERLVNQFEGVRDSDLARKLSEYLGIPVAQVIAMAPTPVAEVAALQEAADE